MKADRWRQFHNQNELKPFLCQKYFRNCNQSTYFIMPFYTEVKTLSQEKPYLMNNSTTKHVGNLLENSQNMAAGGFCFQIVRPRSTFLPL